MVPELVEGSRRAYFTERFCYSLFCINICFIIADFDYAQPAIFLQRAFLGTTILNVVPVGPASLLLFDFTEISPLCIFTIP